MKRHDSACDFKKSGNVNLARKDATTLLQKSIDTPGVCFGSIPETKLIDCDVLEASNTPKRKHNMTRGNRGESSARDEMEYETSGRVHRNHVDRRDTRSRSPSKYYNEKVSCVVHIYGNVS